MNGTVRARADGSRGSAPEADDGRTARIRAAQRRRWAVRGFSVTTVVALAGVSWLGYQGYDASLKVRGGATAEVITDPSAPGYIAAVDASPVHLVALTDSDDELSAVLLFVPDPSGGGTIVWSLGELVVERAAIGESSDDVAAEPEPEDGTDTTAVPETSAPPAGEKISLATLYADEGLAAMRAEYERVLGFGATDAITADPAAIATAAGPLGQIAIRNPDPISVEVKGKRSVKYKAGELALEPDEVGEFVTTRGAGEQPVNRGARTEIVLDALIERLAGRSEPAGGSSSTSASTNPAASGSGSEGVDFASVLTVMGSAGTDFVELPTERQSFKGSYLYSPDAAGVAAVGVPRPVEAAAHALGPQVVHQRVLPLHIARIAPAELAAELAQHHGVARLHKLAEMLFPDSGHVPGEVRRVEVRLHIHVRPVGVRCQQQPVGRNFQGRACQGLQVATPEMCAVAGAAGVLANALHRNQPVGGL